MLFEATGTFSTRELMACVEQVLGHPHFRPQFNHLVDLRRVMTFEPMGADIRIRAGKDRGDARFDAGRIAIVSSADNVFGLARMYETLTESAPATVRTFRDVDAGRRWPGLPPN